MSVPIISFPSGKPMGLHLFNNEGIHYQSSPDKLVEDSLLSGDGTLSNKGALVIKTGKCTGRSPKDKFIVYDEITARTVDWNDFNQPIQPEHYSGIYKKMMAHIEKVPDLYIRDCFACASKPYRMNVRVVTEKPWMSLFAYNMFLRPTQEELKNFKPEWHVIAAPNLKLNAAEDGVKQENAIVVSFAHKTILIAGTGYTGEIKKSIFSILNFILPKEHNVLSMHCSANVGDKDDTAIFFGLSGTGKTTLSADPSRLLIGDDEHGWNDNSVFNFEGGCYAKTINLSQEREPDIFNAIKPGALVENVVFFPGTNEINFDDGSITENTRVSYPLHFIDNVKEPSIAGIPKNIFFLTCDAFGILPPISLLTPAQAMYQFMSGYTAKIAGTETGITEPKPTFSACFGAPFLPLHPFAYAQMLGDKLKEGNVKVWLVNTGWTGGEYGIGSRIKLSYTRAMIRMALDGKLEQVEMHREPVFGFAIPVECEGIPKEILTPQKTWQTVKAFDEKRKFLAGLFIKNFERYQGEVSEEIREAGPKT